MQFGARLHKRRARFRFGAFEQARQIVIGEHGSRE